MACNVKYKQARKASQLALKRKAFSKTTLENLSHKQRHALRKLLIKCSETWSAQIFRRAPAYFFLSVVRGETK